MNAAKLGVALSAALVGSAMSAAALSIALITMPLAEALVIHAISAPILFIFVSVYYFQRHASTTPLQTAFVFALAALFVEYFVLGSVGQRHAVFGSLLGTWMPLVLIFSVTHITGLLVLSGRRYRVPAR